VDEQLPIVVEFSEEIAACVEVEDLFRQHQPTSAPDHVAGEIVLWTSARSHRTFKVMVKDCKLGYALEAAKLNRALFEDMVCAHWATQYPDRAVSLIAEHERYTDTVRSELYEHHGLKYVGSPPAEYAPEERERLDKKYQYGTRSWTGKGVPDMVKNVASMWPQSERRVLMQMTDIAHQANNVLLHHSAASLRQGVIKTPHGYQFDVGPSKRGVSSALRFGCWTYANTISLVLEGGPLDRLNAIMSRYSHLFTKVRSAGEAE
jgi:hypothetical protein